ncbi:MAG: hypothetical protein HeimC3_02730 [Candidatus Heimdallarchaeota archaeon LC_3]|nr:MAG: hypothetical protein HeimC3_02730 [Candidatus Heimdallarchaeota archaeon LC_3]
MSTMSDTVVCPVCGEHIPSDYVVCPYDGASLVKELRAKMNVKISLREGISRAIRIINPQKTKKVVDEYSTHPDRKGALFVLYTCSFLFAFRLAPYLNASTDKSVDILYFIILGFSSGLIIGSLLFLFAIVFWYGISFIYHISAKYLSGSQTATFKESQGLIGYSFSPLIVGLIVLNILLFFIVPEGFSNNYNVVSGPEGGILSPIPSFSENFYNDYWIVNLLFFSLFLIWGAWIVSLGTEKMFRTKRALSIGISAVVPIILLVLIYFT